MVQAGAGAGIFDIVEPEPHKKWTGSATLVPKLIRIKPMLFKVFDLYSYSKSSGSGSVQKRTDQGRQKITATGTGMSSPDN
jgi:hypothetical protein